MKPFRFFAAAIAIAWISGCAFNPQTQLNDAKAVAQGQCKFGELIYVCYMLQKGNEYYVVAVDRQGPLAVYRVPGMQNEFTEDEMQLVWSREPSRRRNDNASS